MEDMDSERVKSCLELAGLWDRVQKLPYGMDSLLNRELNEDGVELSGGERQKLLLAKALYKKAFVVILDEPTAALNDEESDTLLNLIQEFKEQGITSILISHKLREVTKVCDAITIIRDGETIETLYKGVDEITEARIIKGMVGRELTNRFPARDSAIGGVSLEIRNWNVYDPVIAGKQILHHISMYVRKGEVLGIAGLMGAGRTELAMSIFGRSYGTDISGELRMNGKPIQVRNVPEAIRNGIAYVSEDRHVYGMIQGQSITNNITLPSLGNFVERGTIDSNKEVVAANEYREKLSIRCYNVEQDVSKLSGGNQQKVIFSKWVLAGSDVLILDEIYQVINEMVAQGKSVILISSDMPEILGMCDRTYIMNEGYVVGELEGNEIAQVNIMNAIMQNSKVG